MAATKGTLVDVSAAGRLGGKKRAENLTPAERKEAARKAIKARWDAYYKAHPEKLKAKKESERKKPGK